MQWCIVPDNSSQLCNVRCMCSCLVEDWMNHWLPLRWRSAPALWLQSFFSLEAICLILLSSQLISRCITLHQLFYTSFNGEMEMWFSGLVSLKYQSKSNLLQNFHDIIELHSISFLYIRMLKNNLPLLLSRSKNCFLMLH